MTARTNTAQRPAPQASCVATHEIFFTLFAGPLAWYAQLCCGYALASSPCFIDGDRSWFPASGMRWALPAMWSAMGASVLISLIALVISWRAYQRTKSEAPGDEQHVMEVGAGRTRFLALWGILLAAGFALAIATTAVAFPLLSRCSG